VVYSQCKYEPVAEEIGTSSIRHAGGLGREFYC